jgi:hypothetical protein
VFFYAMGHPAQEPSTGRVAADGTFEMSVRQPGDGAIVGTNQVWVKYDPDLGEQDPDKGGWQPLPPPKVKVPDKYQSAETSGIVVEVPPEGLTEFKLELQWDFFTILCSDRPLLSRLLSPNGGLGETIFPLSAPLGEPFQP